MRARTVIGAGLAVALASAIWSYQSPATAQSWGMMGGPGMMDGYGPGHMGGWRGEQGAGPQNCPAFAQNDGQDQGYGPGYHMRGFGGGYGPGMMRGYGPGYGRGDVQGDQSANQQGNQNASQNLNLATEDVKTRMERWLAWRGNPRLKVGEVKEKDADTITADVVTKDNSLVERLAVDRHTGNYRPSEN